MIDYVVKHMHTRSEHFVGGHLGSGTEPRAVRASPDRDDGAALVGYELSIPLVGIMPTDAIVGIEIDGEVVSVGAYPGYFSLYYLYMNPGKTVSLVVAGGTGLRTVEVVVETLSTSSDVPTAGASSPLGGSLLGPIRASKENSPESAQDGGD